jgi:hypothetical protein
VTGAQVGETLASPILGLVVYVYYVYFRKIRRLYEDNVLLNGGEQTVTTLSMYLANGCVALTHKLKLRLFTDLFASSVCGREVILRGLRRLLMWFERQL